LDSFLFFHTAREPIGELVLVASGRFYQVSRTHVWRMEFDDDGFPSIVRYRIELAR
jgi:hypothetical protein